MNVSDQIKDLENTRAAKVARMEEVAKKSMDAGRSMDESEAEEFDGLDAEVKQIDADITRLRKLEAFTAQRAVPAVGTTQTKAGDSRSTSGPTIIVKSKDQDEKFKGQNFTRIVIAKTLGQMLGMSPIAIAQQRWGKSNPTLVQVIRAAVAGGGTDSGEWGAELAEADSRYTGDFIDFLYGATVFDQLPLREVPANVTIKGQDGAATGYWVGQSKSIPVTKADYMDVTLEELQVGAIAVVSKRLLRDASPSAEMLVRDALVNASAQRIDTTFLSATAASAGVSPAGLLNGVTGKTSAGSDQDGVLADILALYADFIAAKNASSLAFVTTTSNKKALGLMVNTLGNAAFPEVAQNSLRGDPLYSGDNVGAADLILLKPSDIYKIGDRGVEVSLSTEASIQMDSAPDGESDTPTANASVVSMFQTESVALKVVRPFNFAKRRASAVAYVKDANYGLASGSTS